MNLNTGEKGSKIASIMEASGSSVIIQQFPPWVGILKELGIPGLVGVLMGSFIGWINSRALWKKQANEEVRRRKVEKAEQLIATVKKYRMQVKNVNFDIKKAIADGKDRSLILERFRMAQEEFYETTSFVDLWATPTIREQFELVRRKLNKYHMAMQDDVNKVNKHTDKQKKYIEKSLAKEIKILVSNLRAWILK